jgi:hypothetical protein
VSAPFRLGYIMDLVSASVFDPDIEKGYAVDGIFV